MKKPWFKEWGWVYRPVSWQAWVCLALTLLFCVQVFVAVDRLSHSASDTLYGIFPFVVPACGVLLWIASKTSAKYRGDTARPLATKDLNTEDTE